MLLWYMWTQRSDETLSHTHSGTVLSIPENRKSRFSLDVFFGTRDGSSVGAARVPTNGIGSIWKDEECQEFSMLCRFGPAGKGQEAPTALVFNTDLSFSAENWKCRFYVFFSCSVIYFFFQYKWISNGKINSAAQNQQWAAVLLTSVLQLSWEK